LFLLSEISDDSKQTSAGSYISATTKNEKDLHTTTATRMKRNVSFSPLGVVSRYLKIRIDNLI